MKTRMFVLAIVLILVVSLSFADEITVDDIYGTWVNADYNEKAPRAKWIRHKNGTLELYNKINDNEPSYTGKETMTGSWHDEEGNLWTQSITVFNHDSMSYLLSKYSDSGNVWELVWSEAKYPNEMSPIGGNYSIYYRQE